MNIVFNINGGIGKCIAATAVCAAIKKQYKNSTLIVISGYPEVFLGNPHVNRCFGFGQTSYFYSDYIEGKEFKVLSHDPYLETAYIRQDEHLIKTWCEMFGIEYNGEMPQLFLTDREQNFYRNQFVSEKPILLLQTNGGAAGQENKYSWARDIPANVSVAVIDALKDEYNVAHLRREDQMALPNTTPVTVNFRAAITLISMSQKRLFMDSFAQHAAAALSMPSTVLWIGNKPEVFGYDIHDNIKAKPETKTPELRNSFFAKYNITGDPLEFPYNSEDEIFDVDAVIESLKS